jgi:hypothetical protein
MLMFRFCYNSALLITSSVHVSSELDSEGTIGNDPQYIETNLLPNLL